MKDDFLRNRKRALEKSFFAKYNAQLLEELKRKDSRRARKEALAEISGIDDDEILRRLADLEIESETLAALTLIPLVEVAWADGSLDPRERQVVLRAAARQGLDEGTPARALLESWLDHNPDPEVMSTWKAYVGELVKKMSTEEREQLKSQLLSRARRVADAAGGFLGINKISDQEASVLRDLESAF